MSKFSMELMKPVIGHAKDVTVKGFEYGKWMYTDAPRWFGFFAGVASVGVTELFFSVMR